MAPAQDIGTLHFVQQTIYKAEKAMVAAKFNGLAVKTARFDAQKDAQKEDFLVKNPTGKVPFLETDMGCIFTSNAIARYVSRARADTSLYGNCFDDEGQIDTWLEFCTHELEVPLMTWVYPVLGLMEDIPKATADAQADVKKAMTALESQLKGSAFLIGDFVTLADIAVVCALREGFVQVFDAAFRKPFPKTTAWFEKCCGMPQFKAVLGDVKLCTTAGKPKPVIAAFAPPARGEGERGKKVGWDSPAHGAPRPRPMRHALVAPYTLGIAQPCRMRPTARIHLCGVGQLRGIALPLRRRRGLSMLRCVGRLRGLISRLRSSWLLRLRHILLRGRLRGIALPLLHWLLLRGICIIREVGLLSGIALPLLR